MTWKLLAAVIVLALNGYIYWQLGSEEVIPPREHFENFPDELDSWRCDQRQTLDEITQDTLDVTDYLACTFYNEDIGRSVDLYIGYHQRQTRDRDSGDATAIHPPEHCLPGSGWDVIDAQVVPIDVGPGGEAKRFVIAKGNHRALVYFWYHSRGRVIARNHHKIFWMFLDRARYGRTDGSLVRFTVPILFGDTEAAEQAFQTFADIVTPMLDAYVPK